MERIVHKIGELAYVDSFIGLIPCKTVNIVWRENNKRIKARVTKRTGIYRKGDVLEFDEDRVVPRNSVFIRGGQYIIRNNYSWEI